MIVEIRKRRTSGGDLQRKCFFSVLIKNPQSAKKILSGRTDKKKVEQKKAAVCTLQTAAFFTYPYS
ncbi:MAG TPA: hypothetical protein DEB10_13505 [Ruminococcaceae bacterium]|nr:hypothetical protein [Oscillospiraceae bacterium]